MRSLPVVLLSLLTVAILVLVDSLQAVPAPGADGVHSDTAAASPVETDVQVKVLAHLGGYSQAVEAVGDHALVGEGRHLLSVDLRDPTLPRVVWRSPDLGADVRDIHVEGGVALVATGVLHVLDIGDPTAPTYLGPFGSFPGYDVVADGSTAYVLAADRFRILDISDPGAPRQLGAFTGLTNAADISVAGGLVWVAESRSGLRAVDVRDPSAPIGLSLTASEAGIGYAMCVASEGQLVVVAGLEASTFNARRVVAKFDATDPTAPRLIGSTYLPAGDLNGHCALRDGRFYHAEGESQAAIYAVAGAGPPVLVSRLTTAASVGDVAPAGDLTLVVDDLAYMRGTPAAGSTTGLHVFRTTGAVMEIGRLNSLNNLVGVAVANGRAYVTGASSGLHVLDVADPRAPSELGHAATTGFASRVAVDGDAVLVASDPGGLLLFDRADPTSPRLVASVPGLQAARALAAAGGVAVVADEMDSVMLDISTPAAPREVGRLRIGQPDTEYSWGDAALSGRFAFFTGHSGRLYVADLADPALPRQRGVLGPADWASGRAVAVQGKRAYLGERVHGAYFIPTRVPPTPGPSPTGSLTPTSVPTAPPDGGRLTVVDVSDPDAPRAVSQTHGFYSEPVGAVVAAGSRVWLLTAPDTGWRSLIGVDVSDPSQPRRLTLHFEPGLPDPFEPAGLAADRGLVYVASRAGLLILQPARPASEVPRAWLPWGRR